MKHGEETPEIKKKRAEALRKAYYMEKKRVINDPESWWNKMLTLTHVEYKNLPDEQKTKIKYMSKLYEEYHNEERIYNLELDPKYQAHRELNKLITDKEREYNDYLQSLKVDVLSSPNKTNPDMGKMQPRNVNIPNYNFEQYTEFTRIYKEQMENDKQRQLEQKRMFKYIHTHPEDQKSLAWKRKLFHKAKHDPLSIRENVDTLDISKFVDNNVNIDGYKLPNLT